jgi:lipopolysaccharide export system permease protein
VFGLRMAGFACSVLTVKTPTAAVIQYGLTLAAIGIGVWIIFYGFVIEPPAVLIESFNKSIARMQRLFRRPATA